MFMQWPHRAFSFLIVAFAVFLRVKGVNQLRRQEETVDEATEKTCPFCRTQIPIAATGCPHCTFHPEAA